MKIEYVLEFIEVQFNVILVIGKGGEVYMFNLLKFCEFVVYEDGWDVDMFGCDVYLYWYGVLMIDMVRKVGGSLKFFFVFFVLLVGEMEMFWDMVVIIIYLFIKILFEILMIF